MWSSSGPFTRRATLLGGLCALGACGFVPAYGTNGAASALRGQVSVSGPDTIAGFRLRTRLEDRLGMPTGSARYALTTTLDIDQEGAAISSDGSTTRFSLAGTATYDLRDQTTGQSIAQGSVDSFTAYSTTGSTVAAESAREDALARLAVILADLIVTRLLAASP
jgi:LPS-assembly lipoprotein